MSSGGTTPFSAAGAADDVECRACYGVVVACVSLLLFCVLAATADVVNACAVSGFAVVFFGAIGWMVPTGGATTRGSNAMGARRADDAAGAASALRWAGCACHQLVGGGATAIDVPLPAFTYGCAADARMVRAARCAWSRPVEGHGPAERRHRPPKWRGPK